jgi:hypothetical protein
VPALASRFMFLRGGTAGPGAGSSGGGGIGGIGMVAANEINHSTIQNMFHEREGGASDQQVHCLIQSPPMQIPASCTRQSARAAQVVEWDRSSGAGAVTVTQSLVKDP